MNSNSRYRRRGFERLHERILMTVDCDLDAQIQQVGRIVSVTACDDQPSNVHLQIDADEFVIELNGETSRHSASSVDEIRFVGGDNHDQIRIDSRVTSGELIRIAGSTLSLRGDGYEVSVSDTEIVRVGPSPGLDVAEISDSPGKDELYMHDDFSTYVSAAGSVFKLSGMEQVEAESSHGGRDRVWFYDSPADDRFVSKGPGETRESFAYMVGDGFWNYAKGFARVDAVSGSGGRDEARLYGTPVRDFVDAKYLDVELWAGIGTDSLTSTRVRGYAATRTYSEGGDDDATISGAQGITDRFVWRSYSAFMHSNTVFPDSDHQRDRLVLESSNVLVGFNEITAMGETHDFAELHGTPDRDEFVSIADVTRFTTEAGLRVSTSDFRIVRAHSRGGRDSAHLMGSPGNERYFSKWGYAYLEGDDWLNYVSPGFDVVADVTGPGHDVANPSRYSEDRFEVLVEDGRELMVYGPHRIQRLFGFDEAVGETRSLAPGAGLFVKDPARFSLMLSGAHTEIFSDHESVSDIIAVADTNFPVYELVGGRIQRVLGDGGLRGIVLSHNFVPVFEDEFTQLTTNESVPSRLGYSSGGATISINAIGDIAEGEEVVLFDPEAIGLETPTIGAGSFLFGAVNGNFI